MKTVLSFVFFLKFRCLPRVPETSRPESVLQLQDFWVWIPDAEALKYFQWRWKFQRFLGRGKGGE
jgi:hypothetical protein